MKRIRRVSENCEKLNKFNVSKLWAFNVFFRKGWLCKKKIYVIFFTLLLNLNLIKKYRDLFLLTLTWRLVPPRPSCPCWGACCRAPPPPRTAAAWAGGPGSAYPPPGSCASSTVSHCPSPPPSPSRIPRAQSASRCDRPDLVKRMISEFWNFFLSILMGWKKLKMER